MTSFMDGPLRKTPQTNFDKFVYNQLFILLSKQN